MLPTAPRAMLFMMLVAITTGCGDGPSGPLPVAVVVVTPNPVTMGVGKDDARFGEVRHVRQHASKGCEAASKVGGETEPKWIRPDTIGPE